MIGKTRFNKILRVALILIFCLMPIPAHAAGDLTSTGDRAFEDLTRCISSKKSLDVYYLIDQSGSLKSTDRADSRADILGASLSALGDFENDVHVNYAVTFFGDGTDNWASWSTVNRSTINQRAAALSAEIRKPSRKNDFNTDWLAGLTQAKNDLADQEAKSHACQALIWLTDGGIWLQAGNGYGAPHGYSEYRTSSAVKTLCNDVMPALRKSGVSVFGVLLKNDSQLDQTAEPERSQTLDGMSHIFPLVEGKSPGGASEVPASPESCGALPIPANQSAGAVLIAKDPVSLALQFLVLTAATQGGIEGKHSPANPTEFTIERGVRKFELVSTTKKWTLSGPHGISYDANSNNIEISKSGVVTSISVNVGPNEIGKWSFAFDSGSRNKLFLFSGLGVRVNRSGFVAGENGTMSGSITASSNTQPVDLTDYKAVPVTVEEILPNGDIKELGTPTPSKSGRFSLSDFKPRPGQTQLELRVTMPLTTTGGTRLKPLSVTQIVDVPVRTNYPTLKQVPIAISDINDRSKGNGKIEIVGPEHGSGRVCFDPSGNNGVTVTSDESKKSRAFTFEISGLAPDGCVSVAQLEPKTLTISASTNIPDEAKVEANLPMSSFSDTESGSVIKDDVPVQMKTTLVKAWEWLVKLALYLLGVLLPWLFSYLLNRVTTKIAFGPKIQRATFPILIHSTKGVSAPDGSPLLVKADDFKFIPEQEDTSHYVDPLGEMSAHVPVNVLRAPWFEISAHTGTRVITMLPVPLSLKKRFASGTAAPIKGNVDSLWAIYLRESDLLNSGNSVSIPATLLIYKRNKLSQPNQHVDVVMKATQTPGIWGAISALPKVAISVADKKSSLVKDAPQIVATKPEGGTPPPPPPPPPGAVPPPPPGF
jgi:hypothetical protein